MRRAIDKFLALCDHRIELIRSGIKYIVLLLLILLFFAPLIVFHINSGSFIVYAGESIAYRYFYAYRMMAGEITPHLWLPQGFLTTSIQKLILFFESIFISPHTQLDLSLQVFGYLTYFANGIIFTLLLYFVMQDDKLEKNQKILILLGLFIPIYGSGTFYGPGTWGYFFLISPDYLGLDILLATSFIYYFYFLSALSDKEISLKMIGIVAFLSGLSVSNKISMIFLAAAPAFLLLVRFAKKPSQLLRVFSVFVSTFSLGFLLPWMISHYPNYRIDNIGEYIKLWVRFVQNAPQELGFIENLANIFSTNPQYMRFLCIYVVFLVFFLVYSFWRFTFKSRQFLLAVGLVFLAVFQLFVQLKTRSAGTTNFEVLTILTSITMMVAGSVKLEDQWIKWGKWVYIIICLITIISNFDIKSFTNYENKRVQNSHLLGEIHEFALSFERPIVVVAPDNSYIYGMGMEEMFLKGFSDFPTWNITSGKKLMNEFAPNLSYRSDYIEQIPEMHYPTGVVMVWYDKGDSSLEKGTNLKEAYPELQKVLSTMGTKCKQWFVKNIDNRDRIINVCVVP